MISKEQYITNYNKWNRLREKMATEFKSGKSKFTIEQSRNVLLVEAKKLGLKIDYKGTPPYPLEPNLVFHTCENKWTQPYYLPEGSVQNRHKMNDCGIGCLCLDDGVDRPSIDKLNRNKKISIEQVCSGTRKHKPVHRLVPGFSFSFTGSKPMNRNSLKEMCNMADVSIDDPSLQYIESDFCNNKNRTIEESKQIRNRVKQISGKETLTKPEINIFGKQYNSPQFWKRLADTLERL